jgi:hypothetical protein
VAKGFGEDLWRNAQAVRLDHTGALHAPVRADGRRGIVVGIDRVAAAEAAAAPSPSRGGFAAFLRRLVRRA